MFIGLLSLFQIAFKEMTVCYLLSDIWNSIIHNFFLIPSQFFECTFAMMRCFQLYINMSKATNERLMNYFSCSNQKLYMCFSANIVVHSLLSIFCRKKQLILICSMEQLWEIREITTKKYGMKLHTTKCNITSNGNLNLGFYLQVL